VVTAFAVLGWVIQLIHVEQSNPRVLIEVSAPGDVHEILRRSCYDCHSNETEWPWYSRIAPASWIVTSDVVRGRRELNFSDWPALDPELDAYIRGLVAKRIEAGDMPTGPYALLHPGARLSEEDRSRLIDWGNEPAWDLFLGAF